MDTARQFSVSAMPARPFRNCPRVGNWLRSASIHLQSVTGRHEDELGGSGKRLHKYPGSELAGQFRIPPRRSRTSVSPLPPRGHRARRSRRICTVGSAHAIASAQSRAGRRPLRPLGHRPIHTQRRARHRNSRPLPRASPKWRDIARLGTINSFTEKGAAAFWAAESGFAGREVRARGEWPDGRWRINAPN